MSDVMVGSHPFDYVVDVVSRTAWGEARGCGRDGMANVISVMVTRAKNPTWWGHDLVSVCLQPYQFSCRDAGDPNLQKLLAVTDADPDFRVAQALARLAVQDILPDMTKGADSYFAVSLRHRPSWTARATQTYADGWHSFWRVRAPGPTGDADSPNIGHTNTVIPQMTADQLNQWELTRLGY